MRRRRLLATAAGATALALAGCAGGAAPKPSVVVRSQTAQATAATTTAPQPKPKPPAPAFPQLLRAATKPGATNFVPAASWRGSTAAWVARTSSGLALISFDQRIVQLRLHAGTGDPGGSGWHFGASVAGAERARLVAAFNGGFKLSTGAGGFEAYGRVGAPLQSGLGSVVTYSDGTPDLGTWHQQ